MASTKKKIGADELGISLEGGSDGEVFRWLIACQLFGARISQDIAAKTWHELDQAGYLTPQKLAEADWQDLVDALGRGGYRRYDESTARELISIGKLMQDKYDGKVSKLPEGADTRKEMSERVREFAGIGPTAAEIFLRDMAGVWN